MEDGTTEKHAWNVLQIDGEAFPVDLTWEAGRFQRGEKGLEYFGCKEDFFLTHNPERDEIQHKFVCFTPEFVNKIDTNNTIKQRKLREEDKKDIIQKAIEETYKKYEQQSSQIAKKKVNNAIMNYLQNGETRGFTRQNNAREGIEEYINQEDMIDVLIKEYVGNIEVSKNNGIKTNDVLATSIKATSDKYGNGQAINALKKYILENNIDSFTRQNNARSNIDKFMSPQLALEKVIEEMVEREIASIEKTHILKENNTQILQKMYFDGGEFAQVQLPAEKEKNLIKKAMEWIKRKTIERKQMNNTKEYKNQYMEKEEMNHENERE